MILLLEQQKLKRTGFFPAFPAGGALAAAFPVAMMAVRSSQYTAQPGNPLDILLNSCWQMMAMLNILLTVCGACIIYHTEYADHGFQKMDTLPICSVRLFLGKLGCLLLALAAAILIEALTLAGCIGYWFVDFPVLPAEIAVRMGCEFLLMLPTVMLMLLVASACRNMWISLGIGVILTFLVSVFPSQHTVLSLCPFITPYRILSEDILFFYLSACGIETVVLGIGELILLKIRRAIS